MKSKILAVVFLMCLSANIYAQDIQKDAEGFLSFEMTEGDTTYHMKQYVICLLKKGPNRDQAPEEAAKIQTGHLTHMENLANENRIHIAGPLGDDGEIQGIIIYNYPTVEEAEKAVMQDPAVIAGRLIAELHPFWAAKGSTLD